MACEHEDVLAIFLGIGLAEENAKGALKNPKFASALKEVIAEAGMSEGCSKQTGSLLYTLAAKCPTKALQHRKTVAIYVKEEKIKGSAQLDGGIEYLKKLGDKDFDVESFEKAAGVGIEVSLQEINAAVNQVIEAEKQRLLNDRYQVNTNQLIGCVTQSLKFADGTVVKSAFDEALLQLLGPKTDEDIAAMSVKRKKVKKQKKNETAAASQGQSEEPTRAAVEIDPYAFYTKPEENHQVHTTVHFSSGEKMHISNTDAQLKKHLIATEGKVYTRFPPEPNGYLHIGHAKVVRPKPANAAEKYDGRCYLRFDDTNPEAEKLEYINHIQEIVAWLGWKPWKVTYSSDYFVELYDLAVKMIKSGHAYVDHQTADEIKEYRHNLVPSPWRDRPIAESLKLFNDMRRGLIDEGKATLRMKQDPKNENPNMYDLIAYRVKFTPHPHVGDIWCIYPSYDFTHCVVDALENITHSLCTLEFEVRRVSYYWLLEVLGLYKPVEYEYSRLNITHNVLSKRKLKTLVAGGYVHGWDDPRLYTLAGLRRRGVTPTAINNFCKEMGITRADNDIPVHRLEHHIRQDLDLNSPRTMAVLRPLKVVITNMDEHYVEMMNGKTFPGRIDDVYPLPFSKIIFIEETDFKEQDEKGYFGLAPGKTVMLRYAYPITCESVVREEGTDRILSLNCIYDGAFHASGAKPPKGVLNWVSRPPAPAPQPIAMEARLYGLLFACENVGDFSGESWLEQINPESEVIVKSALGNPNLRNSVAGDRYQFERLGYFCVDPDSSPEHLVVNRTVSLRDSLPTSLR